MELIPGKLYRAISANDVIEVEPTSDPGLKLLVMPARIKNLKQIQKVIEKAMKRRPDLHLVLNAFLEVHEGLASRYVEQQYLNALLQTVHRLQNSPAPQARAGNNNNKTQNRTS